MRAIVREHFFKFFLVWIGLFLPWGCSKTYIPNTDVRDTPVNRKVISFCEEYRHAVEQKNIAQLLKMASPMYHQRGGNLVQSNDVDYNSLKGYLTDIFGQTKGIRYEIRYRRIAFNERNTVYVDYTYAASYKIPGLEGEEWKHTVADNRLVLTKEGETFKILSGM